MYSLPEFLLGRGRWGKKEWRKERGGGRKIIGGVKRIGSRGATSTRGVLATDQRSRKAETKPKASPKRNLYQLQGNRFNRRNIHPVAGVNFVAFPRERSHILSPSLRANPRCRFPSQVHEK